MTDEVDPRGHDEHVRILDAAIADLAKDGWREYMDRRVPTEASVRRKTGLFKREFMVVWVDQDGNVVRDDIGKEARFPLGT